MPEARTRRRRSRSDEPEEAAEAPTGQVDEASEAPQQEAEDDRQQEGREEEDSGREAGGGTLVSELQQAIREAAIEVLRPVARDATKTAAKAAVTKGPDLVKGKLGDAGGAGGLAKDVLSKSGGMTGIAGKLMDSPAGDVLGKLTGKGKGEGKRPSGYGRGRRLPVQVYVDVAVAIDVAYDQWTQFEELPRFMHRVERIEQRDDETLMWHENIWGVRRSWEAEIVEQKPCERIVWRSSGGPQVVGVVTFHRLSDKLTRIYVNMDFQPKGLFEKTASGFRMSRRALKSDLMRFKAYVEMNDEATGSWRGVIEEGEVVEGPDSESGDEEQEDRARHNGRAGLDEDDEADEEPTAEEDDEEPTAEEEDEEPSAEEDESERPRGKRFQRRSEEEPEEDEELETEPSASDEDDYVDEEDEEDEEEAEERPPARRRSSSRPKSTSRRR